MYQPGLDLTRAPQPPEQFDRRESTVFPGVRCHLPSCVSSNILHPTVIRSSQPEDPHILADTQQDTRGHALRSLAPEKHRLFRLHLRYPTPDELAILWLTILQLKPSGDGCAGIRPQNVGHAWRVDDLEPLGSDRCRKLVLQVLPDSGFSHEITRPIRPERRRSAGHPWRLS